MFDTAPVCYRISEMFPPIFLQLDQPSLGMPSREYYLKEKESTYKDAYLKYMVNIVHLLGANESSALHEMAQVLAFEVELAKVSRYLYIRIYFVFQK